MRLFTLIATLLLVGCSSDRATMERIATAEACLAEQPAEALAIMQDVDPAQLRGNGDRARYALVMSEAMYYNRIATDCDSLTRSMVEYYNDNGSDEQRARALYQHALVVSRSGERAEAMYSLMMAEEACALIDNPRLEGLVHRTMGDIYGDDCLFNNAYHSYLHSHDCFERASLVEHCAFAEYDMGCMLIAMRDYDQAEEVLLSARDYAINEQNSNLLCDVLHKLAELYIDSDNFAQCESCLQLFDEHECLHYGEANYLCYRAMCEANRGNSTAAYEALASAYEVEDRDDDYITYARYVVDRTLNNVDGALLWHEINKHKQDDMLLEVLEQPVLNMQVSLLRQTLDSEKRERELITQRNTIIWIGLTLLAIAAIFIYWYRMRRKNEDIAQYVETIGELRRVNSELPKAMNDSIAALYRDRFSELNELCEIYYDHNGSTRQKNMVFSKLCRTIDVIKSDEGRIESMESAVNTYRDNLMSRLREQLPKLSERDLRVALYTFAGFSNRTIAIFLDSDPISVSKMRYNIRHKLRKIESEEAEAIYNALTEK